MKSKNIKNETLRTCFLILLFNIFLIDFTLANHIQGNKKNRTKNNYVLKTRNIQFAEINIDENKLIKEVDFIKLDSIKIDLVKNIIFLVSNSTSPQDSKSDPKEIPFEDLIIANTNFDIFFNSSEVLKVEYSKARQYRIRKVRGIIGKINEKLSPEQRNCVYFYSNNFINIENLPLNRFNIDLNVICFGHKNRLDQFLKNLKIFYRRFIYKRKKVTKLNYMEGLNFNHFYIRYMHRSHPNNHNGEDSNFLESASLSYNDHGLVLTNAERENDINHILYTFNHDNIKDCRFSNYEKMKHLKRMKNCFQFIYDFRDVFKNDMIICSEPRQSYKVVIKKKYIQETLRNKCNIRLNKNILYIFDHLKNPKKTLIESSTYEKDFIYDKIFGIMVLKVKEIESATSNDSKQLIILRLKSFLKGLGKDFLMYIRPNIQSKFLIDLIVSLNILNKKEKNTYVLTNGIQNDMITLKNDQFNSNGKFLSNSLNQEYGTNKNQTKTEDDNKPDYIKIINICRKHPKFRKCVCSAFPFSPICKKDYCKENKNSFFCNNNYCRKKGNDKTNCECLKNPFSDNCKCLIYGNFDKNCHCKKYKKSIFCEKDYCSGSPKNNHIFCICERDPNSKECKKDYCKKNKSDKRCKCLENPNSRACVCEIVPDLKICKGKLDQIKQFYVNYKYEIKKKGKKKVELK